MSPSAAAVWEAMDRVIDPELDRSLVALDFVRAVEVDEAEGAVHVAVRLPTYWCSPNFAYLMVGDAHDALSRVPGVRSVVVELVDHFAGERIAGAIADGLSFQEAFPDQADGGLAALRRTFRAKALVVRQEPVLRAAREALGDEAAATLRIGDGSPPRWADPEEWSEYLHRMRDLGLSQAPEAPTFTDATGAALAAEGLAHHLRMSRLVRISLQSNTEFCTGLLAARYEGEGGVEQWQREGVTA